MKFHRLTATVMRDIIVCSTLKQTPNKTIQCKITTSIYIICLLKLCVEAQFAVILPASDPAGELHLVGLKIPLGLFPGNEPETTEPTWLDQQVREYHAVTQYTKKEKDVFKSIKGAGKKNSNASTAASHNSCPASDNCVSDCPPHPLIFLPSFPSGAWRNKVSKRRDASVLCLRTEPTTSICVVKIEALFDDEQRFKTQ